MNETYLSLLKELSNTYVLTLAAYFFYKEERRQVLSRDEANRSVCSVKCHARTCFSVILRHADCTVASSIDITFFRATQTILFFFLSFFLLLPLASNNLVRSSCFDASTYQLGIHASKCLSFPLILISLCFTNCKCSRWSQELLMRHSRTKKQQEMA